MLSERGLRAILYFLAAYHLATGLLALIAPGTFFEEIGNYAPENENLHFYLARVADRLERAAGDASRPVPTE
jgi:hypothetical protein